MLESLRSEGPINIFSLSLSKEAAEKRREPPFVPERDITEKDWEMMAKRLNGHSHTLSVASKMALIDHARTIQLMRPDHWEYATETAKSTSFAFEMADLIILNKDLAISLVDDARRDIFFESLDSRMDSVHLLSKVYDLAHLDRTRAVAFLSDSFWNNMKTRLQQYRLGNNTEFTRIASRMAFIDYARIRSEITSGDWEAMIKNLDWQRSVPSQIDSFCAEAAGLSILSRAEAEALRQEQLAGQDYEPLPEIRKF